MVNTLTVTKYDVYRRLAGQPAPTKVSKFQQISFGLFFLLLGLAIIYLYYKA